MIEFREPPRTGFELTWRLFGIRFRVMPSFFLIAAILAFLFVGLNPIGIAVDVACIFVAILFTEFVQGLVYRSYGLRSTDADPGIWRRDLSGSATAAGFDAANRGGACQPRFELFVVRHRLLFEPGIWLAGHQSVRRVLPTSSLWLVSLFWGIIGLLPIFPYPGGRVMLEVLTLRRPGMA